MPELPCTPQATASTTRQAAAAAIAKPPLDPCTDHRSKLEDVGSGPGGGINVGAPDQWLVAHDDLAFVFLAGDSIGSRSTPWGVGSALQDGEAGAGPGGGTIPPQSCAQTELQKHHTATLLATTNLWWFALATVRKRGKRRLGGGGSGLRQGAGLGDTRVEGEKGWILITKQIRG